LQPPLIQFALYELGRTIRVRASKRIGVDAEPFGMIGVDISRYLLRSRLLTRRWTISWPEQLQLNFSQDE
ncbi:hypothetical protein, partial [Enterobacter asburiae]|uniref:hypothetical protein n=1 Tax=Enterobacter asburiae TaxID=61645 RepID=UPI0019534CFC